MDTLDKRMELSLAKKAIEKAGLYLVQETDFERLAQVAADAYLDYPLQVWFSGGRYDPNVVNLIILCSLKTMKNDAVIYADSKEMNGFAIWLPTGFSGTKTLPFLVNGGLKLMFYGNFGIINKLISYEAFSMKLKKEITNHNDWYLYNLSVKQDSQGKGIARKLLRPMLDLCDEEDMVAYLETNKEANVGIYKNFGFTLKKKATVPNSHVDHYAMARDPIGNV